MRSSSDRARTKTDLASGPSSSRASSDPPPTPGLIGTPATLHSTTWRVGLNGTSAPGALDHLVCGRCFVVKHAARASEMIADGPPVAPVFGEQIVSRLGASTASCVVREIGRLLRGPPVENRLHNAPSGFDHVGPLE